MANPIVEQETEDGETQSKLVPGNLGPGEAYPLKLVRVSQPYDGEYGPYLFAQVQTQEGEEHTVIVGHNVKAPGFLEDGERTAFDEAFEQTFGEYPERRTPGRSLADCFYEAPVGSEETVLERETGQREDGTEFNLYFFGLPSEQRSPRGGIRWREEASA